MDDHKETAESGQQRFTQNGPPISIIVPVRDKVRFLPACLDSILLAAHRYGRAELIVVDNMSTDGAWELLQRAYATRARLERSTAATVAGVRNQGAKDATGSIFCFVDSDCIVPVDYCTNVVATMRTRDAAAVGHGVSVPETTWIERAWQDMHHMHREGPARWLPGACFSVTADAFRQVGGFQARLVSGEDIDLAERLRTAGVLVWSTPALVVVHLDNPTTIGAFLRKEIWRGKGALPMGGALLQNKVLVMSFAYMLSLAGVVGLLATSGPPFAVRAGAAAALVVGIPLLTVLYRLDRVRRGGGGVRLRALFPGSVLYAIYYIGRATAAVKTLLGDGSA